jgi:hypothetical protein
MLVNTVDKLADLAAVVGPDATLMPVKPSNDMQKDVDGIYAWISALAKSQPHWTPEKERQLGACTTRGIINAIDVLADEDTAVAEVERIKLWLKAAGDALDGNIGRPWTPGGPQ